MLAHRELSNFQHNYSCCKQHPPPSGKKEWFDVEEEVVIQVVQRWIHFMKQGPYGTNGKLKNFWKSRLDYRIRADEKERFDDHHIRHRRWSRFVFPTWADWVQYYTYSYWRAVERRLPWIRKYRWQVTSISLAFWLSWTMASPYHIIGYLIMLWCFLELTWEGALGAPVQTRVREETRMARKIGAQTVTRTLERISSFPTSTSCT